MSNPDPIASGTRCVLRSVRKSDLPAYFKWYLDGRVQKPLANPAWDPGITLGAYRDYRFNKHLRNDAANRVLTIDDETGVPIGMVNFFDVFKKGNCCEVGILIGEVDKWQQGYAGEALQLLLDYLDDKYNFDFIEAQILNDNLASQRLFATAGFRYVRDVEEEQATLLLYRRHRDKT